MNLLNNFPRARRAAGRAWDYVQLLRPHSLKAARVNMTARRMALAELNTFSRMPITGRLPGFRNVLVDGMWDNPNYWTRYCLLRRALGLAEGQETGLLGAFAREKVRASFELLGIDRIVDFMDAGRPTKAHHMASKSYVAQLREPGDVLTLEFPQRFPASLVYDGLLKRQRRSAVDVEDPLLADYIAGVLAHIDAAEKIIKANGFDLIVLSHALDWTYSSLAWAAVRRGIPVLVLYGDYGCAQFFHMRKEEDLFCYPGQPTRSELAEIPPEKSENIRCVGSDILAARFAGKTGDVGADYAYRRRSGRIDKMGLVETFGWDAKKPIIGVYNSNWFDFPHSSGLREFRDFLDWIELTLGVACQHAEINWLFKSHPCDDWYASIRGLRVSDLVEQAGVPHVRMADKSWNGSDLILSLDGVITCHGTIGIEAASLGKPVLVPYPGWYGHAGFVVDAGGRDGYLAALDTEWWKGVDTKRARGMAELFAGWMFCMPDWHQGYAFQDDSRQEAIFFELPQFLKNNAVQLDKEAELVRAWVQSRHMYYAIYKNVVAERLEAPL